MILLMLGSGYRQSVYLSSANVISSSLYRISSNVIEYFHLKSVNQSLQVSNASLQSEVLNLKNRIAQYEVMINDSNSIHGVKDRYNFIQAAVINNNTYHPKNYFTIDKGAQDGLESGMGVVDQSGVVGIVDIVGSNVSRVISLLNETQKFSTKLKDTPYVGTLNWRTGDPSIAYLEEIPRHAVFHIGDTVVTSGYSTSFPEGIPVGIVLNKVNGADDSFFTLKVKLLPKFKSLSVVRVIKDVYKNEIDSLFQIDANEKIK